MEQYISKSDLVAEIKKRINNITREYQKSKPQFFLLGKINGLENIISFIDTLEVKEVDLEKECSKYFEDNDLCVHDEYIKFARHFFELGMQVSNTLTVKDIKKIYHLVNEVSDDLGVRAMYVSIYQEVLKRFKAQKGE